MDPHESEDEIYDEDEAQDADGIPYEDPTNGPARRTRSRTDTSSEDDVDDGPPLPPPARQPVPHPPRDPRGVRSKFEIIDDKLTVASLAFKNIILKQLGMTYKHHFTLYKHGYTKLDSLKFWEFKQIRKWCEGIASAKSTTLRVTFGDYRIKMLQGLAWFVTDAELRGVSDIRISDFIDNKDDWYLQAQLHYDKEGEPSIDKPSKFKYEDWVHWEESLYLYLDSIKNQKGIPMSYVIRKDLPVGTVLGTLSRNDQIIYNAKLSGPIFDNDSKNVLSVIKESVMNTNGDQWIKRAKCGRKAMQAMQSHYDGSAEGERRKLASKEAVKRLFYKHEYSFSFEKYCTMLMDHFNTMERYEQPLYEVEKVDMLLDQIINNHPRFLTEVQICRSSHAKTFEEAVTYLKTAVAKLFPPSAAVKGRRVGVGAVNERKKENGVDITDISRWFSREEWGKLSKDTKKRIATNKKHQSRNADYRKKAVEDRESRKKSRNTSATTVEETNRMVASIINGVTQANRHERSSTPGTEIRVPRVGTAAVSTGSGSGSRNDDMSQITYDHVGNPIRN